MAVSISIGYGRGVKSVTSRFNVARLACKPCSVVKNTGCEQPVPHTAEVTLRVARGGLRCVNGECLAEWFVCRGRRGGDLGARYRAAPCGRCVYDDAGVWGKSFSTRSASDAAAAFVRGIIHSAAIQR